MKILFTGCSWTYGDELQNPMESRYSKLICDYFKINEYNIAKNGNPTQGIIRLAFNELEKNDYDVCCVQISGQTRFELPFENKIQKFGINYHRLSIKKTYLENTVISSNSDINVYNEFNYHNIILFDAYCKLKNIKPLFYFLNDEYLKWFKINNKSQIDYLDYSLKGIVPKEMLGPRNHSLEDGHKIIANRIIGELEKRLK